MRSEAGKLADQVAIVTGAAQGIGAAGIGAAIAALFARAGAKVVVCDINVEGAARVAERLSADGHEALVVKRM